MPKKKSTDAIVAAAMRKVLNPPAPRRKRAKTEADVWFEQMKADYVKHGAEHLASAKAKMSMAKVYRIQREERYTDGQKYWNTIRSSKSESKAKEIAKGISGHVRVIEEDDDD